MQPVRIITFKIDAAKDGVESPHPWGILPSDLMPYLVDFEQLIIAIDPSIAPSKDGTAYISLKSVEDGCAEVKARLTPPAVRALIEVEASLKANQGASLSQESRDIIKRMTGRLRRGEQSVTIMSKENDETPLPEGELVLPTFRLDAETVVADKVKIQRMKTFLHGRVKSIHVENKTMLVATHVSTVRLENMPQPIWQALYNAVGENSKQRFRIEGTAFWNPLSLKIERMHPERVKLVKQLDDGFLRAIINTIYDEEPKSDIEWM